MNRSSDSIDRIQMKGALTGVTRLSSTAKFAILLFGFMVFGFIVFSIISIDQHTHSAHLNKTNRADWEPSAGRQAVQPAKPAFEKMLGHAADARLAAHDISPLTALSGDLEQQQGSRAPLPSGLTFEKRPARHDRTRKKEDRRQQNAIQSALEMSGGGRGERSVSDLNAGLLREPSKVDRLRRVQSDRITSALSAAAQAARVAQNPDGLLEGTPELHDLDPNQQGRKEQFLRFNHRLPSTSLNATPQRPISPFEIKAGWVIPAALECGLNSDLPGQTCARVTENVYDTATGRTVLIPQGTKVIGTYDSRIAYGQQRILVVWNRLIFPDASSIRLNGMPGTDKAGHAGFDADVNHHTWGIFKNALLMAVFSAGIGLTQQHSAETDRALNNDLQTISQSVGQQLGHTGVAMIRRGMNIQPTLTRPPGYAFNIIATRDIVFPGAYRQRAMRTE